MERPQINTALPERRYHIGTFQAVILGDIESPDENSYFFILALVPEGVEDPVLYVISEEVVTEDDMKATVITVRSEDGEKVLGPNPEWRDIEGFARDALAIVQRVMRLTDEAPNRLM
ncbi:MAG: hypothetical protein U5S82_22155 [Gammaproteobacteria bacterium]|nr:hypothetical protein [Gammaproteobacteria bacterium]